MKYLCLAYGSEAGWNELTQAEKDALLAQDEAIRQRGATMGAVKPAVTTVQAWSGVPVTTSTAFAEASLPLAGFSIIEAQSVEEVVKLVSGTPCARAKGYIEVRPILVIHEAERPGTLDRE